MGQWIMSQGLRAFAYMPPCLSWPPPISLPSRIGLLSAPAQLPLAPCTPAGAWTQAR